MEGLSGKDGVRSCAQRRCLHVGKFNTCDGERAWVCCAEAGAGGGGEGPLPTVTSLARRPEAGDRHQPGILQLATSPDPISAGGSAGAFRHSGPPAWRAGGLSSWGGDT